MAKKLKQTRGNLLKAAKEIDRISKCYHAKKMKVMTIAVKALLNNFYRY